MILSFNVTGLKEEQPEIYKVNEIAEITPNEKEDTATIENLLDDQKNIKSVQRFVVVQQGDTYQSIAERFHVDERDLIQKNHSKPIQVKMLISLPNAD